MALQLGALRDALIEAQVSPEKAAAAAEEVAGYENRLTKLTTMVQAMIAIGMLLLASQAGVWVGIGKVNGTVIATNARVDQVSTRVDQVSTRVDQVSTRLDQVSTRLDQVSTRIDQMSAKLDQIATAVGAKH